MKLSAMLCASVLALAVLTLAADGAFAETTIKSSKSNSSETLDPNCTGKGGTVSTDKDGNKICTRPAPKTRTGQTPPAATLPAERKNCSLQGSKGCCETNGFRWGCAWAWGPADDEGHSRSVYKCWCSS